MTGYTIAASAAVLWLLAALGDGSQDCGRMLTSVSPERACYIVNGGGNGW